MNAEDFFRAKLTHETDVSDVHQALEAGEDFVLVDSRGPAAWAQGHVPQAIHLPTSDIPHLARRMLDPQRPVVTYCWGPGCNGATRAALALAEQGFTVREMIGGIEYWIREGFEIQTSAGRMRTPADRLTAPVDSIRCEC